MVSATKGLPVRAIPEQPLVAAMWNHMVNDGCRLAALHASGMPF
jgi:hypothetical protein